MAKFQSPLLGYNNNVRHKNRQFHIQTEDSGVNHPHIITHLFMDGGRILKSVKKSYAEHVGADGMSEIVRGLMKEQHKAMFIALRDGQFDHLVDPGAAAAAAVAAAAVAADAAVVAASAGDAPGAAAPPTNPEPARAEAALEALVETSPNTIDETKRPMHASVPPPASAAQPKPIVLEDLPPPPPSARPPVPAIVVPPAAAPRLVLAETEPEDVPMTTRQPPEARPDAIAASAKGKSPSGRELTLDFDALERASTEGASPSLFHSSDLPPPPKNLFSTREPGTGGAYRAVEADPRHDPRSERAERAERAERSDPRSERSDPREEPGARGAGRQQQGPPPSTRGDKSPQPGRTAARAPGGRPNAEARYAPARPAAIFGSTQRPQPQSIFSDELVSDKSLDEVILSYLAEDLEPPRRK